MNPDELIRLAEPGDAVVYRLRGPATDEEIGQLRTELEASHPGVHFEITADHAQSHVELKRG